MGTIFVVYINIIEGDNPNRKEEKAKQPTKRRLLLTQTPPHTTHKHTYRPIAYTTVPNPVHTQGEDQVKPFAVYV